MESISCGHLWTNLFDGKTLKGWTNHDPKLGSFVVENGIIVGTPFPGALEGDVYDINLTYQKEFTDFILEFTVKMDVGSNSGVQFRSHVAGKDTKIMEWPMFRPGQPQGEPKLTQLPLGDVYGYQFELMDASTGRTGDIFDESRRKKWLDTAAMKNRPGTTTAFKDNEWNDCRVEVRGDHVQTWVNGIACADFHDTEDKRGVVGLQIHGGPRAGVNKETGKGLQVRWRTVRIQELH